MSINEMIEGDQLLAVLAQEGKEYVSDVNKVNQSIDPIKTTYENLFNLLANIQSISDPDIITGLLFHMVPFISISLGEEVINQLWLDLANASATVSRFPDVFAIVEAVRTLTVQCGNVNISYLQYLSNKEIEPTDLVRPYALEALYDYLPELFFTVDESTKKFFSLLIANSILLGDIQHRSFLIQILFAIHLTSEQLSTVPNLPQNLWKTIFDISLFDEDNISTFSRLLVPVNKMKILIPQFFEIDNIFINQNLDSIQKDLIALTNDDDVVDNTQLSDNEFGNYLDQMLNLFKIFPYFPSKDMVRFIEILCFQILPNFKEENWKKMKDITHLIYDSILESKFLPKQIESLFNIYCQMENSSAKFYVFIHFDEFFCEFFDFRTNYVKSICMWKNFDNFDPVVFCFCLTNICDYLFEEEELFQSIIIPTILETMQTDKVNCVYYSIKALTRFYREDLINIGNFINTVYEIAFNSSPKTYKFFFKLIQEVINATRWSVEDDKKYSEDDEANDVKEIIDTRKVYDGIQHFVRSNLWKDGLHPIFYSYLLDTFIFLMDSRESESLVNRVISLCIFLTSSVENPEIFSRVTNTILNLQRSFDNMQTQILPIYTKIMYFVLNNDLFPDSKTIVDTANLCSYIAEENKLQNGFDFPIQILVNFLNYSDSLIVQCSLNVLRRMIPMLLSEADKYPQLFTLIIHKVIEFARCSKNLKIVNMAYKVFIEILKGKKNYNIDQFSLAIDEMKKGGFQEKLAIYNHQSITKLNCLHFLFFNFVKYLFKQGYQLLFTELLSLIQWIQFMPYNLLPDLLLPISQGVINGAFDENGMLHLWNILSLRLNELVAEYKSSNEEAILAVVCAMNTFLSNVSNPAKYDFSVFLKTLEFLWCSECHTTEETDNMARMLCPLFLNAYKTTSMILEFNFSILDQIGEYIIDEEFNFDYPTLVNDIITIYNKFGTLHRFSNVGAEVILHFLGDDERVQNLGFSNQIETYMFLTLKKMMDKDPRIFEYLSSKYSSDEIKSHMLSVVYNTKLDL